MGRGNQGKETTHTSKAEALAVWLELTSKQQKTMREQIKVMEKAIIPMNFLLDEFTAGNFDQVRLSCCMYMTKENCLLMPFRIWSKQ